MKLTYTHWQHGRVTRDVQPVPGSAVDFYDRARIYRVGAFDGEVFSAGRVLPDGTRQHLTPVRIGWDGWVRDLSALLFLD